MMRTMNLGAALVAATVGIGGAVVASEAMAREVSVRITNTTHALYFTPVMAAVHHSNVVLFELGESASANLQAMAEGGDTAGLAAHVEANGGEAFQNISAGLLGPGESATVTFDLKGHDPRLLSMAAMLLPTNDGFVGLNSVRISRHPSRSSFNLLGYDAGTEANDELITGGGAPGAAGIPADPGGIAGAGGTGVAGADINQTVHVHRGNVGDDDASAGASDLDSAVHRWLNPVARVVIVVH